MRLVWNRRAIGDREAIFDFIEADDPKAALTMDVRISTQAELLPEFPLAGRPGRVDGTRELVLGQTPYILAYRVLRETIEILRVLHGAQQWPDGF